MKVFSRLNKIFIAVTLIAVAAVATFSGCTTVADYTLGEEFTPGNQQMKIRYRLYKDGMLKESEQATTACKVFETRLFRTDSIISSSLSNVYLGAQNNARFGNRQFSFAGQFLYNKNVDDSVGFGYRPVLDSVMFIFAVDTFAGDTTKPVKYHIFELKDDLVAADAEDTIFYANYDARSEGHLASDAEPIFTFSFPDPENGVYTKAKSVRLKETAATKAFMDRLMCKGKLDANGLANNNVEAYESDSAFVYNFPGIYIEVAEQPEGEGSVFALSASSTGIQLLGRTRNAGSDADILADTLDMSFTFRNTNYTRGSLVGAQSVHYDFNGSELENLAINEVDENRDETTIGYIDGCGGVFTEVTFTDEFLYSLRNLSNGDKTFVSAAINQAALRLYIEGAEYDYNNIDPIPMSEKLNASLPRLGIYTDYKTLTPIPDYLYTQESSGMVYYNGYINRSLACYQMNISSYMQALVNDVLNLEEEADGTLDFDKMDVPRTLYIAPGAYDRFSLCRSIIQGGDNESNPASVQLDLTYTLVK